MSKVLSWKHLGTEFGALIDYDLRKPMTDAEQEELRALLLEHDLLVFRKQNITKEDQTRVMSSLGPILSDERDFGLVSNVRKDGAFGLTALEFHSDNVFGPEPIVGSSLYALEVVDDASSTNYASTVRAYEKLPADLRDRLRDLEAIQVMPFYLNSRDKDMEDPESRPHITRPVVIQHRVTEIPMLCVCPMNTYRIKGISREESDEILKELFAYIYTPDNVYEHKWHNGDLVIWDNLATQHARGEVKNVGPRTLQRVAIGPKGFFDQYAADTPFDEVVYVQN